MTAITPKDLRKTDIRKNQIKENGFADRFLGFSVLLLSILCFAIIVYPLWFIIIASISNCDLVNQGKVVFWPRDIKLFGYKQVFTDPRIWNGYKNTFIYVIAGTTLNLAVTMPAAYALSRPDFRARNPLMLYFVFTMYFSGGLVPLYMTISSLGLISTKWILIIFVAINTYNMIIARTFIQSTIPTDLYEAAILDGCSHFTFFTKVVLPLSKAIISVEILYYGVFHWNDYFNALVYNYNQNNEPLQMALRRILLLNETQASGLGMVQGGYSPGYFDQVKYAVMIVSTVPILCVYPFVQKYFEKGVMIGAVKG